MKRWIWAALLILLSVSIAIGAPKNYGSKPKDSTSGSKSNSNRSSSSNDSAAAAAARRAGSKSKMAAADQKTSQPKTKTDPSPRTATVPKDTAPKDKDNGSKDTKVWVDQRARDHDYYRTRPVYVVPTPERSTTATGSGYGSSSDYNAGASAPMSLGWIGTVFKWILIIVLLAACVAGLGILAVWLQKRREESRSVEFDYYNPLRQRKGGVINIDDPDYKGTWRVQGIREVSRDRRDPLHLPSGGDVEKYAEYDISDGSRKLRLRYTPKEDADGIYNNTILILGLTDEFEYDDTFRKQTLREADKDGTGKFVVRDDKDDISAEYWRPQGLIEPYACAVKTLKDRNRDGRITPDEVTESTITMWDFSRQTKIDGNVQVDEFLIVEMDQDGYFEIRTGREVTPERVTTLT